MSTRERRVTLALKWHHLDNLSVEQIQDRFEADGIGSFAKSTVRKYLNEEPAEAVLEQIENEHANTRLQAAERYERLYQQAREDHDELAVEDEPVRRVVPQTAQVPADRDSPMMWDDWELVDEDDPERPVWATERDVVIRFTSGRCQLMPGEEYPVKSVDGSPKYTTEMIGLERDVPELTQRQSARSEMSQHLRQKADVLGVYSTDINLDVDQTTVHELGEDEKDLALETLRELQEAESE